jgi:hypothetical protein
MRGFVAPNIGPPVVRAVRLLARAASIVSLLLLAQFAFSGGEWPSSREWLLIAFFPVGVATGTIIAWHRELLGGSIAAGSLLAFHALLHVERGAEWPGAWFLVFASPALALGVCGLLARRTISRPKV